MCLYIPAKSFSLVQTLEPLSRSSLKTKLSYKFVYMATALEDSVKTRKM